MPPKPHIGYTGPTTPVSSAHGTMNECHIRQELRPARSLHVLLETRQRLPSSNYSLDE
jgi:hypothetical protein